MPFLPGFPEIHVFRCSHIHEPFIGHQAEHHIIQQVEKNNQEPGTRQVAAEHRCPADVGNKIQDMRDNRPVKPDLFLLPGTVQLIADEQDSQHHRADNIRHSIKQEVFLAHSFLLEVLAAERERFEVEIPEDPFRFEIYPYFEIIP